MDLVLAVLKTNETRTRISNAVEGLGPDAPAELTLLNSWGEAFEVLEDSRLVALVFDPYIPEDQGPNVPEHIRRLPWTVRRLAYGDFSRRPARDVLALQELGVHDVVTRAVDDSVGRLRELLFGPLDSQELAWLLSSVEDRLTPALRSALRRAYARVGPDFNVQRLVELYGASHRSLSRHCKQAGLPYPKRLVSWLRVLVAASHFTRSDDSLETVARAVGYSDAASLTRALRSFGAPSGMELRSKSARESLRRRFLAEVRCHDS